METSVIIVAFTLVSTIIVFKVVPQFLARIVISAMVGVASLCTLSPSVITNPKDIRDWRKGISMYVAMFLRVPKSANDRKSRYTAVMLVLAIVVS